MRKHETRANINTDSVNNLGLIYADLGQLDGTGEDVTANADELGEDTRPQSDKNNVIGAENSAEYSQSLSVDRQNFRSGGQDFLGVSALFRGSSKKYRGLRREMISMITNRLLI